MQKLTRIYLLVLSVFLSGCLSKSMIKPELTKVKLSEGFYFDLLKPQSLGFNLTLTQLAEIEYNGNKNQLMFQTEIDQNKIVMLGLAPSGTRLFTLIYNGKSIEVEGFTQALKQIDPHFLLADMQLSLWPIEQLKKSLSSNHVSFIFNELNQGLRRELKVNNKLLLDINYAALPRYQSRLLFNQHQRQYRLVLTTLSFEYEQMNTIKKGAE